MKKLPRGLTKAKLDKRLRELVKARDEHKCRLCGSRQHLNVHHIMAKRSILMRYYLPNCITLCSGCHIFGVHSADGEVAKRKISQIIEVIGEKTWNDLVKMKKSKRKMSLVEADQEMDTIYLT